LFGCRANKQKELGEGEGEKEREEKKASDRHTCHKKYATAVQ